MPGYPPPLHPSNITRTIYKIDARAPMRINQVPILMPNTMTPSPLSLAAGTNLSGFQVRCYTITANPSWLLEHDSNSQQHHDMWSFEEPQSINHSPPQSMK
ncbi:MAG: hypothetical protein CL912_09655 [Deltaproteobacteria bacterium]|nr:hypothetical protein [Deltaproteobacteria bacterium]